jgi:hypothetical protein
MIKTYESMTSFDAKQVLMSHDFNCVDSITCSAPSRHKYLFSISSSSQVFLLNLFLLNIILRPLQDINYLPPKLLLQPQFAHGIGPRIDAKLAFQASQHNLFVSLPHPRLQASLSLANIPGLHFAGITCVADACSPDR